MSSPIMERWYLTWNLQCSNQLLPLSFLLQLLSISLPFSRCCNRRLEGNHDEHGAVCVGPIALGRPEEGGSFCSGKWTAECGTNCGGGWRRAGSRGAMKVGLC